MSQSHLNRRKLLQSSVLGLLAIPTSACLGAWRRESVNQVIAKTGAIAVPNSTKQTTSFSLPVQFAVEITGSTEAGSFGPLPALLELTASQADDLNPFVVSLYMVAQSDEELVNGSIFWQSFVPESPQRDEHFSQVTVSNNQVQLQVSPSSADFRGDVMWFTQLTGTLAEMMGGNLRSGAVPTTGTMIFVIEGNQISGQMQLSGMSDLGIESIYQAQFSGQQS